jgi:hypothetical protein
VPPDGLRKIGRDFRGQANEVERRVPMFAASIEISADLNELAVPFGITREEVDFKSACCAHVGNLRASTFQLEQHRGFERMSEVRSSHGIVDRDQAHIYRIDLARVDHALSLGFRRDRQAAQPLVFEAEVEQSLAIRAFVQLVGENLPQEGARDIVLPLRTTYRQIVLPKSTTLQAVDLAGIFGPR